MSGTRRDSGLPPYPGTGQLGGRGALPLDEQRIACANSAPTMVSLADRSSERGEEREAGMLPNTDAALLERTIARLATLGPCGQPGMPGRLAGVTA